MEEKKYSIKGMHCSSCAVNIENTFKKQKNIKNAQVNYALGELSLQGEEITDDFVDNLLAKAGDYSLEKNLQQGAKQENIYKWRFIISALLALPFFFQMFFMFPFPEYLQLLLASILVFVMGFSFHKGMLLSLKNMRPNMDTLVSFGTIAAFALSTYHLFIDEHVYFETAGMIIVFILLGKYLEEKSKGRASEALKKLFSLGVKNANVLREGKELSLPIEDLKYGDVIRIKAGEKVPLDAEIIKGASSFDESFLTGESIPVEKEVGELIYAASINQYAVVEAKVLKVSSETLLKKIIHVVEEAQQHKAPIQKLADKISLVFVPLVLLIAIITFSVYYFALSSSFEASVLPAIAVLLIACPCALGLATPTALMVGSSRGASKGILLKNAEALEASQRIDTVVFDKTGTLTHGDVSIADIFVPEDKISVSDAMSLACSLESFSEHLIAKAFKKYAKENNTVLTQIEDVKILPGRGIGGTSGGHLICLCNHRCMKEKGIKLSKEEQDFFDKNVSEGKTTFFLVQDKEVLAVISLSDTIREESKELIRLLQSAGKEVYMMTGDHKVNAEYIGAELGINKVFPEVLPQDKLSNIKKLQKEGKFVAFVGDGINDAPALVGANLGIAIGEGSDIALESGDIILTESSPMKIYEAMMLSEYTYKVIKQNFFFAFIYNILAIPLAAFGILTPMIASLSMGMSSVSVVLSSLRIGRR